MVWSEIAPPDWLDERFELGLDVIIRGLASYIERYVDAPLASHQIAALRHVSDVCRDLAIPLNEPTGGHDCQR